jgi:hypothetical protein
MVAAAKCAALPRLRAYPTAAESEGSVQAQSNQYLAGAPARCSPSPPPIRIGSCEPTFDLPTRLPCRRRNPALGGEALKLRHS